LLVVSWYFWLLLACLTGSEPSRRPHHILCEDDVPLPSNAIITAMMRQIEEDLFRSLVVPMTAFDTSVKSATQAFNGLATAFAQVDHGYSVDRWTVVCDIDEREQTPPQFTAAPADRGARRIRLED
jgi:hypothetical protein